jgi:phosphoribosyl-AMP cyclohydrolase
VTGRRESFGGNRSAGIVRRESFGGVAARPYDGAMPAVTPIPVAESDLAEIRYDETGLVPAVIQAHDTNEVLMVGWMNAESLRRTLDTGRVWFWSRSRRELWCKGETSGDRQYVRRGFYDCDGDVVLFTVEQEGRGACHTGNRSCFYREFGRASDES